METVAHIWLEKSRIFAQNALFAFWFGTLWVALWALCARQKQTRSENSSSETEGACAPKSRVFRARKAARLASFGVLSAPVLLWSLGATLETMRRLEYVPSLGALMASLAAFSLLLAGVFVLVREWFVIPRRAARHTGQTASQAAFVALARLDGSRLAWTFLLLTLAGWFFGGFALPFNSLFTLESAPFLRGAWPEGWLLLVCGAQLLGAAKGVQSPHETAIRVLNPKFVTWQLLLFALLMAHPRLLDAPIVASVALAGFVPFLLKSWGARRRFRRGPRLFWLLVGAGLIFLPLFLWAPEALKISGAQLAQLWKTPGAFTAILLFAWAIFALTKGRLALRRALQNRFSGRALLLGTAFGAVFAALLLGPSAALFWAFFPLAGLFFDLLARDERTESGSRTAERADAAFEPATEISAGSRQTQNR